MSRRRGTIEESRHDPIILLTRHRRRIHHSFECSQCTHTFTTGVRYTKTSVGPVELCPYCLPYIEEASFAKAGGDAIHTAPERKRSRG